MPITLASPDDDAAATGDTVMGMARCQACDRMCVHELQPLPRAAPAPAPALTAAPMASSPLAGELPERMLTTNELAKLLAVSRGIVASWRAKGVGPKSAPLGRARIATASQRFALGRTG